MARHRKQGGTDNPLVGPPVTNGQEPVGDAHEPGPKEEPKSRPTKSFSYPAGGGAYIEASVWPKKIQYEGREVTVYSVTCRKTYTQDGEYKHTQFFRGSEVYIVVRALERASEWILDQRVEEAPAF